MDIETLAGVLKPLSSALAGALLGPAGAVAAPVIIDAAAKAFGVEPTAEAVAAEIQANPAAGAIVASVERDTAALLAEIEARMLDTVNATMRLEMQSESWGQRWWRPLFGLTFNAVWTLHGLVMGWKMWGGDYALITHIPNLTIYYGVAGAAVGIYVWRRTDEKKAGLAGPTLADAAGAAIAAGAKLVRKGGR